MTTPQYQSQSLLTKTVLVAALLFFTVHFLIYAADLLIPLVVALLIWFLINAMATSYLKLPLIGRFIPWGLALTFSIITIPVIGYLVINLIVDSISDMGSLGVQIQQGLETLVNKIADKYGMVNKEVINKIVGWIGVERVIGKIASAMANLTSQLGIVLVYVVFLLADQQFFPAKIKALVVSEEGRENIRNILETVARGIQDYLWVMTLVSALTAGLSYGVMIAVGLDHAAFWAFIIFVLNFIPTIGSIVSTFLPALFTYLQFQNYLPAIILLVVIGIIQLAIGNILLPRLAGSRLNLSQFIIVLALFVWSAIWGVIGMFLAVPITSMLMITFSKFETTRPWAILLSQKGQIDPT